MKRNELDEKVLEAITTLQSEGKSPTVNNIEEISGLLKYQIYTSKHKNLLDIRSRIAKSVAARAYEETVSGPTKEQREALAAVVEGGRMTLKASSGMYASQGVSAYDIPITAKTKKATLELTYKFLESALKTDMKEATADDIDDAIENLNFLFKNSIERLELEK